MEFARFEAVDALKLQVMKEAVDIGKSWSLLRSVAKIRIIY